MSKKAQAKESLKDWIKAWSYEGIVANLVAEGMSYMANKITTEELKEYQQIVITELVRREQEKCEEAKEQGYIDCYNHHVELGHIPRDYLRRTTCYLEEEKDDN